MQLKLFLRIFRLMEPYRVKRNWLFFCVFLRGLQQPAFAWAVGAIIDGPIAKDGSMRAIGWAVFGLAALSIFMQVTLHFRQRLTLEMGESVVNDLRRTAFAHLQRMPLAYFHKTKVGRILSHINGDCNNVRIGVQDVLFVSLVGMGQMFFSGLFMAYYSLPLFGIVLVMSPIFWLINRIFQSRLSQAYRDIQESFSRVTAWIAENLAGMKITQAFVRGHENSQQFDKMIATHAQQNMKAARISGVFLPLIELNSQLFMAAVIAVGGYLAIQPNGSTSLGDLIQFFFLANIFFSPIQALATQYNQALTALAAAERLFELVDQPTDPIDAMGHLQSEHIRGEVEFCNVTFGYEPGIPILRDISFVARPGQSIALVGPSGGGKSTLTNLIARNYVVDQGSVLIDGIDIKDYSRSTLTKFISIVPQQNYLFSGTIADNLRFARPDLTDGDIWNMFCQLGCIDIFEPLPDGIETEVGTRGSALSAGQRQLICLARALAVEPRVLILDEATSSIDPATERKLQTAIEYLQLERTSFVVAHRLSTIRKADSIMVIDQGVIVQQGTHDELKNLPGIYADLLSANAWNTATA